jgi:hypothetical protein
MQGLIDHRRLLDTGVILEYQLPLSSKRLDCLVTGRDCERRPAAVVVELKQWERCEPCHGENEVVTWVGGAHREVLHPSAQVGQYRQYLQDMHTSFSRERDPVGLRACSYLHNYPREGGDPIFAEKFARVLQSDPLFTKDDFDSIGAYLAESVGHGDGLDVLADVEDGVYRPSKKLMEHVAGVIADKAEFILLDEQLIVFDRVLAAARAGMRRRKKQVIIVKGGPGTGKSVVAMNLMGRLLKEGVNAHYATGSKAFTGTLRNIIGTRGSAQFKFFNSYGDAGIDAIDVLICDEAHRIRRTSSNMYTPRARRTEKPQIDELVQAARVSVYFIDDDQVVRPDEIGSSELIRARAVAAGAEIGDFEFEAQFRCAGSDAFVNWVNSTLGIRRTANPIWSGAENFEFRIIDSPQAVEDLIRTRAAEGYTARMTAGFCWPWSKLPRPDGTLEYDVKVGAYERPWNAHHDATHLARGIPKATLWARDAGGLDQVGCVYTAQGFEFDYVGVIWGRDLIYDLDRGVWVGQKDHSFDSPVKRSKDRFVDLVRNTYRVLLTRGLKGCYVCFEDRDTERFVRSRVQG